jgi:hypothetical protein
MPALQATRDVREAILDAAESLLARHGSHKLFAVLRPALLERRFGYFEREATILGVLLEQGSGNGELLVDDPIEKARLVVVATNALSPHALSASELGRRADAASRAERIADLLLHGLLRRQDGRSSSHRPSR